MRGGSGLTSVDYFPPRRKWDIDFAAAASVAAVEPRLSLNLQTLMQLVGNTGGTEGTRAGAGSSLPRPRSPQAGLPPVALAIVATLVGFTVIWLHALSPVTAQPHEAGARAIAVLLVMTLWCLRTASTASVRHVPPQEELYLDNVSAFQLAKQQQQQLQEKQSQDKQSTGSDATAATKYSRCDKCSILRPAKAHHCKVCGFCVLSFDHHCDALNNCVGAHNYKAFLLLLTYALASIWLAFYLLLIYNGGVCGVFVTRLTLPMRFFWSKAAGEAALASINEHYTRVPSLLESLFVAVLLFVLLIMSLGVGLLGLLHHRLVCEGEATVSAIAKQRSLKWLICCAGAPADSKEARPRLSLLIIARRYATVMGSFWLWPFPVLSRRDLDAQMARDCLPFEYRPRGVSVV